MSGSERKIVFPGEQIRGYGSYAPGEGVIKQGDKLTSCLFGILSVSRREVSVIPYKEVYRPKKGDVVVGVVVGYGNSGWFVDIGSYTKAFLHVSEVIKGRFDSRNVELSDHLKIGDVIIAKVTDVPRIGYFQITIKGKDLGKVTGDAYFIKVNPVKLRRIIGRRGSMINLIKDHIGGEIILGKNGVIVYKDGYESFQKLKNIINLISEKTFASGLTAHVAELLSKGSGGDERGKRQ